MVPTCNKENVRTDEPSDNWMSGSSNFTSFGSSDSERVSSPCSWLRPFHFAWSVCSNYSCRLLPCSQYTTSAFFSRCVVLSLKSEMLREKRQICATTSSESFFCPKFVVPKLCPNIFAVNVIERRSPRYSWHTDDSSQVIERTVDKSRRLDRVWVRGPLNPGPFQACSHVLKARNPDFLVWTISVKRRGLFPWWHNDRGRTDTWESWL